MISIDLQRIIETSTLIKQGAEAKVYKINLIAHDDKNLTTIGLLKFRFQKKYRHPKLDEQLTKNRLTFEARCLVRALKMGISVPLLKGLDLDQGWLIQEWIDGITLRSWLQDQQDHSNQNVNILNILNQVGIQISKLHSADIIHGDLTTSNIMLKLNSSSNYEIVLIDFGLSSVTSLIEDKAVDLYVLERAFISTHSNSNDLTLKNSSPLFQIVLESYAQSLPQSTRNSIKNRLANVRSRGRKRNMIG